jgi:hypothetical protein
MSRVFDTGRAGETSYDVAPAGAEFSLGVCERSSGEDSLRRRLVIGPLGSWW